MFKIGEYLSGLPSNNNSIPQNIENVKDKFIDQFNKQKLDISAKWYSVAGKAYILHVIVPSHSVKNINYDVILEFNVKAFDDIDLLETPCKVFSNCPSFTFTYAKVFYDNGILCHWLRKKYPKEILRKEPDTTNPLRLIGYERSLYIASLYIKNEKNRIGKTPVSRRFNQLENMISSSDEILDEYQRQKRVEKNLKNTSQSKGGLIERTRNALSSKVTKGVSKAQSLKTTRTTQHVARMKQSLSTKKTKKI